MRILELLICLCEKWGSGNNHTQKLRHLCVLQHYTDVTHYVIYGLKTLPGYVKTGINARLN